MVQCQRQHACGHATGGRVNTGGTTQVTDQTHAPLQAVQQHGRVFATGTRVGGEQGFEGHALLVGTRVGIGQRAARAHRGAGAAAHAQTGVDHNLLALDIRANGRRRAHVNTGGASHLGIAGVRTQLLFVSKKAGLLKLTHQTTQSNHGLHQVGAPRRATTH